MGLAFVGVAGHAPPQDDGLAEFGVPVLGGFAQSVEIPPTEWVDSFKSRLLKAHLRDFIKSHQRQLVDGSDPAYD